MNYFRIYPPIIDDFDTTIIRIEKNKMQKLGINEGDTVKVTVTKSTGATCYSIDDGFKTQKDSDVIYKSHDADTLPQLRPSNFVAENITDNAAGFIPAVIEKIHDGTRAASKVLLMSLDSGKNMDSFDKSKLNKAIVCKNNRFYFRNADPQKNFAMLVTSVEPSDYCQINKDTIVKFVSVKPEIIHTSYKIPNLKKLQDVIPITYQKTLHNVTVTIPSLEIFDTGFKVHVYTKGEFDESNIILDGHTSIVVSLHDDSGNRYILTERGMSGSRSPLGFDYKHEFHGKPICSDVKQLTITLREIIIQERFPKPNMNTRTKNIMRWIIKEEYEQIDKFPSFCIIPGPWKVTFSLKH